MYFFQFLTKTPPSTGSSAFADDDDRESELPIRSRSDICPDLIDLLGAEDARPRRHLALAVVDRLLEARALVRLELQQIERPAAVAQPLTVAGRAMHLVDLGAGFDLRAILRQGRRDHQRTDEDACWHTIEHWLAILKWTRHRCNAFVTPFRAKRSPARPRGTSSREAYGERLTAVRTPPPSCARAPPWAWRPW